MAHLRCFESACQARYQITDVLYNCPKCGGLLEAAYPKVAQSPAELVSCSASAA